MTSPETKRAVVENGVRWAKTILVELSINYERDLTDQGRKALSDAINALSNFDLENASNVHTSSG